MRSAGKASLQKLDVTIAFGSWVFLAGMLGFCGGISAGVLTAAYATVFKHDIVEGGETLIGMVVGCPISFSVFALLGYPIYRLLASTSGRYRVLRGTTPEVGS